MKNIERLIRKGVNEIRVGLGLKPKLYPSPEEARIATILEHLNKTDGPLILNLVPPEETNQNNNLTPKEKA